MFAVETTWPDALIVVAVIAGFVALYWLDLRRR